MSIPGPTPHKAPTDKSAFWCATCTVGAMDQHGLDMHNNGKKHLANLRKVTTRTYTRITFLVKVEMYVSCLQMYRWRLKCTDGDCVAFF